ncbi:MAG: ATP-binding protein [Gammaproteobacteria bacterium]|nr:ATP-binding protein [Gammaproteobacteria bacterium]MDH3985726.1 ATP-binding protein [Gammaproteobacteria bacterium]
MPQTHDTPFDEIARRILWRLFLLRNITVTGVGAGVAIANEFFTTGIPAFPIIVTLGLLAGLNILTWLRLQASALISNTEIFIQLLLDIAGITSLFYFTGGAANPFVWFYLLPLIIAATILPRTHTWIMAGITVACYSALLFFAIPIGSDSGHAHHESGFRMHILGMWLGFVMSAGFVAVIIVGMAHSLRERDRKLAEAREQALQNERLIALGTLATGAAHELGTPLGTMAILTAELEQEYSNPDYSDLHRKLGILREQISRCKETLSVISVSAGAERAEAGHRMPVKDYLDHVITEWREQRPNIKLDAAINSPAVAAHILAERTLSQALINILNNAADASPDDVYLQADWSNEVLNLEVSDRGPGLSAEIYNQLGKTPVTTKDEGLGVGLFLAQATIQRLGGKLSISNREANGTTLRITLPLLTEVILQDAPGL